MWLYDTLTVVYLLLYYLKNRLSAQMGADIVCLLTWCAHLPHGCRCWILSSETPHPPPFQVSQGRSCFLDTWAQGRRHDFFSMCMHILTYFVKTSCSPLSPWSPTCFESSATTEAPQCNKLQCVCGQSWGTCPLLGCDEWSDLILE